MIMKCNENMIMTNPNTLYISKQKVCHNVSLSKGLCQLQTAVILYSIVRSYEIEVTSLHSMGRYKVTVSILDVVFIIK